MRYRLTYKKLNDQQISCLILADNDNRALSQVVELLIDEEFKELNLKLEAE